MHISRLERLPVQQTVWRETQSTTILIFTKSFTILGSLGLFWFSDQLPSARLCIFNIRQREKCAVNTIRTSQGLLRIVGPACLEVLLIDGPGRPSVTGRHMQGRVKGTRKGLSVFSRVEGTKKPETGCLPQKLRPPLPWSPAYQTVPEWGVRTGGDRLSVGFASFSLHIIPSRCLEHPGCEWGTGNRSVCFLFTFRKSLGFGQEKRSAASVWPGSAGSAKICAWGLSKAEHSSAPQSVCVNIVYSYHTGGVSPPYQLGKGQVFSFCFVRIFPP